jgi:hypothetical protein
MFFRTKWNGYHRYLQVVENRWEGGRSRQHVAWTVGRLDVLEKSGELESLLRSGLRFTKRLAVLDAGRAEQQAGTKGTIIGPGLVFERLWKETGIQAVVRKAVEERKYTFAVERAVFLTVLHRLFAPGSDRAAEEWKEGYRIEGAEGLQLHQLYRAMAWLGEKLPRKMQPVVKGHSPRCVKDKLEEMLFAGRQTLFGGLDMVFFDTTSLYFEGAGGETLGENGLSKDKRPDLKQMVVGAVLDQEGNPVCSEMWPGNTTDVTTLVPVVRRLKREFGVEQMCAVADRGMISAKTIATLESKPYGMEYILGARMRRTKEVREDVLMRCGRWHEVYPPRTRSKDPSPLKVKEVMVEDRRYIVCHNEEQARKDAADREAIVAALREALRQGDKSLIGNKGFRKFVKATGERFTIDEERIEDDARFDGKWVLRTNTGLNAADVALKYKQLWMVEDIFRSMKSLLATRPIYHRSDATIRGHVFCSFLALILRKALQDRLDGCGLHSLEWAHIVQDLNQLREAEVTVSGKRFVLREECKGSVGHVLRAVGVAPPPTMREVT